MITLTTDFGLRDWFVGTMKGVIAGIAPRTRVVDITHEIDAGDIHAGAFALAASHHFFPKGTIHVAVVDPGVGSGRRALVVETRDYIFVGPDNGILSLALGRQKLKTIRWLEHKQYFLHPISRTFHGRDVFASAAAHLARGVSVKKLGPEAGDYVKLNLSPTEATRGAISGKVVYVDRFGNAITNIDAGLLSKSGAAWEVILKGGQSCRIRGYYQATRTDKLTAVIGSTGYLEVAVNGGSAARKFGLMVGVKIVAKAIGPA